MSFDESPMRQPSHTMANQYKLKAAWSQNPLDDHVPQHEAQIKEVVAVQPTIAVRGPPLPKPDKPLMMAEPNRQYDMWPGMCGSVFCIVMHFD